MDLRTTAIAHINNGPCTVASLTTAVQALPWVTPRNAPHITNEWIGYAVRRHLVKVVQVDGEIMLTTPTAR